MEIGSLIAQYGYWAIAAGALLEGETVLALGGLAAHLGYLKLPWVVLVAAAAGFCGDQCFYWVGRRHGARLLARFEGLAGRAARVNALIERYHEWVIVGVRFAWGLRIAGPILIGMSAVPPLRFALFNALGAALWATLIAGLGWSFGATVESILGRIRHVEGWLFLGVAAVGAALWLAGRWRSAHARRRARTDGPMD